MGRTSDAVTLFTGKNVVTGEQEGMGGRFVAALGLFTPASGGELRGIGKIINTLTERFGDEVASFTTKAGAVQREWVNKKSGMKHVLRGPETAPLKPGGPDVTHWNYEQHVPRGKGRYSQVQNIHLDSKGSPIP
jgi:hypothetical protein